MAADHTGCHKSSSTNQARIFSRELPQHLRDMRFEVTDRFASSRMTTSWSVMLHSQVWASRRCRAFRRGG
jgi:hypothetical protein